MSIRRICIKMMIYSGIRRALDVNYIGIRRELDEH